SAVQPWNVRNTEHMVVPGYCGPVVRWAASHGSYCSTVPSNRCRNASWYSRVIHRSSVPGSRWLPSPAESVPGGRRRIRSGYSESRPGGDHRTPSAPWRPPPVEDRRPPPHLVALPGLHLWPRPVDRVDLGLGTHAGEEVVAGSAVLLGEPVPVYVVDQLGIPVPRPVVLELPPHHRAPATAQLVRQAGVDRARRDV